MQRSKTNHSVATEKKKKKNCVKRHGLTLLILPKIFDPEILSYLSGALDSQYTAG